MSLLCHRTMDWQLALQALSLPLRLVSCTLPLLDGPSFHHADQPAFAFKSRQFRRCTGLHLLLPSPLKGLTVWQHGDWALRGITPAFSGAANGNGRTIKRVRRGLRCNALLDGAWLQLLSVGIFPVEGLLDLDAITDHPKLYLLKLFSPPLFKSLHPAPILGRVWNVNNQPHKVISV